MKDHEHKARNSDIGKFQGQPLKDILSFFRTLDVDPNKVRAVDIDFVYLAMFAVEWSDAETEYLRTQFLKNVGPDSARDLCTYVLHRHGTDRLGDGFTDEELEPILGNLTTAVILLLHHADLAPDDFRLELGINADGALCARMPPDEVDITHH